MYSRQIKLYLDPADREAVIRHLHDELACVLLKERSSSPTPEEMEPSQYGTGCICRRAQLNTIAPKNLGSSIWLIGANSHPVIDWSCRVPAENLLRPGRFYYVPGESPTGEKVERDDRFLATATELYRWVRRNTVWVPTDWGRERLGAEAARRHESGELGIKMNW